MLKTFAMALVPPLAALLSACGSSSPDEPAPPPPYIESGSRTILVYMVANNNLDGRDDEDITEMQLAAASQKGFGRGNVIIYRIKNFGGLRVPHVKAHLLKVGPDKIDTLKTYDTDESSVSISRMREVIADTKEFASADSYGMVFWSHSSGWYQDGIAEPTRSGISTFSFGSDKYGNSVTKSMDISSLAKALDGADLDFLYFDCCFMGSVEVLYELRHCAPYVVASPCEIPGEGMPYNLNLPVLLDTSLNLERAVVRAATNTYAFYNDGFSKGDCPNTMVVVRTDALDRLAAVTADIYEDATVLFDPDVDYQRFGENYPSFSFHDSFFDFEQYVESLCLDSSKMQSWRNALDATVAYAAASPWIWHVAPIEHYCGLSSYIMFKKSDAATKNYHTLEWYKNVAANLIK